MQNDILVLTGRRSKNSGFWEEGGMVLLLVLSLVQIVIAFDASAPLFR